MKGIHPYLTFNGNCREAMTFYQECLGGELVFQTLGESPLSGKMPKEMKKAILHATLTKEDFILMGTDMVGKTGIAKGNSISLLLNCHNEKEIKERYNKLSQNGEQTHPLEITFFDALFGDLVDQFGNQWLLVYPLK